MNSKTITISQRSVRRPSSSPWFLLVNLREAVDEDHGQCVGNENGGHRLEEATVPLACSMVRIPIFRRLSWSWLSWPRRPIRLLVRMFAFGFTWFYELRCCR